MFTKCPECNIAFRVTAKVLQQAGGNVRCGGCNHAFNALNYLSEEMPEPGADSAGITSHDDLAETSRRLLQTLDELAGSEDVRIEDTGVEWRVLEKGDAGTSASSIDDSDEMRYDDSTLLPDDFGLDRDQNHPPPEPTRRTADLEEPLPTDSNDLQGELLLSEPEDWTDLLDEVIDPDTEIESLEVEEELAAIHNQLSARDEPDATASGPADLGAQFDTQAEAMGLGILSAEDALTDEVPLLNEADIEQLVDSGDRAAEEEDLDEGVEDEDTALSGDFVVDHEDESDEEDSGEFQVDEGEEEHLEEETDDELNLADAPDEVESGGAEEDWESTGEFQSQIDEAARALLAEDEDEAEVVADDDEDDQLGEDEDASDADEEDIEDIEDIEELALEDESEQGEDSAELEHYVPPPTEEEMTVNM